MSSGLVAPDMSPTDYRNLFPRKLSIYRTDKCLTQCSQVAAHLHRAMDNAGVWTVYPDADILWRFIQYEEGYLAFRQSRVDTGEDDPGRPRYDAARGYASMIGQTGMLYPVLFGSDFELRALHRRHDRGPDLRSPGDFDAYHVSNGRWGNPEGLPEFPKINLLLNPNVVVYCKTRILSDPRWSLLPHVDVSVTDVHAICLTDHHPRCFGEWART